MPGSLCGTCSCWTLRHSVLVLKNGEPVKMSMDSISLSRFGTLVGKVSQDNTLRLCFSVALGADPN